MNIQIKDITVESYQQNNQVAVVVKFQQIKDIEVVVKYHLINKVAVAVSYQQIKEIEVIVRYQIKDIIVSYQQQMRQTLTIQRMNEVIVIVREVF